MNKQQCRRRAKAVTRGRRARVQQAFNFQTLQKLKLACYTQKPDLHRLSHAHDHKIHIT